MTEAAVLKRFGATAADRIGHGGEATVYALSSDRVLRIFHTPHGDIARIAAFYDEVAGQDPGFALPRVLEYGEIDGVSYSVDRRIPGSPMMELLPGLSGAERRAVLEAYLSAVDAIAGLRVERTYFGELLPLEPIRRAAWRSFLHARMDASLAASREDLASDVTDLDRVMEAVHELIDALSEPVEGKLVHGDYFPGNVMIGRDLTVSGVIDFGSLTLIGDPLMDVASAIIFLEVARPAFLPEDTAYLMRRAVLSHGVGFEERARAYRAYYALRFSMAKTQDERLYGWCVRSLNTIGE